MFSKIVPAFTSQNISALGAQLLPGEREQWIDYVQVLSSSLP
jgi:hypothetical protein